ncbi:MAG: type II toxin-antitoxin system Phd/YefM family antitoxin [Beijerinckiaceae bacterium]
MSITNIHEAKTNLSKLIDAALRGEEVVIAKAGKPVVRLVAIEAEPHEKPLTPGEKLIRAMGALKGKFEAPTDEEWAESDRYILELFEQSLNKE